MSYFAVYVIAGDDVIILMDNLLSNITSYTQIMTCCNRSIQQIDAGLNSPRCHPNALTNIIQRISSVHTLTYVSYKRNQTVG